MSKPNVDAAASPRADDQAVTLHPPAPLVGQPRPRFAWPALVAIVFGVGLPFLVLILGSQNKAVSAHKATPSGETLENESNRQAIDVGGEAPVSPHGAPPATPQPEEKKRVPAPELDGGVAWLNSGGPLSLKNDLKGKIVLLDFWTLCCINCIHIMPDLAKLEKKYANELVVIGVHSPKFENEKDSGSIRKAILRYQLEHPVINDANHKVWDHYDVEAWPTLVLIDPEGNIVGYTSGEGNYELLDTIIGRLVEEHKKKKTLNEKPIHFDLAKYRESGDTPLFFPGKVLADEKGKRLFIADSTHHRIVITDLDGNLIASAGTGMPGKADGEFAKAEFHDPQGMAVRDNLLYVADRKNHTIRELDLQTKTVRTIAGNGEQGGDVNNRHLDKPVPARSIGLNSPWDLCLEGDRLYIAMAGHHQIWLYDLKKQDLIPYAGSGRENIGDGPLAFSSFAQPSGLASDGKFLYVADSEISSLRKVPLEGQGRVETLLGRGLFVFGDVDGPGRVADVANAKAEARLQHALGVTYHEGKLYIADTYNSKIKSFDLKNGQLSTVAGGTRGGWLSPREFNEPGGISFANGKLYVADTNAHRIRVIDLATGTVSTLALKGLTPPVAKIVQAVGKETPPTKN
jgi:DNA-binding beta-propeller fold protein YncE